MYGWTDENYDITITWICNLYRRFILWTFMPDFLRMMCNVVPTEGREKCHTIMMV
jgi:hypothetical protein